VGGGESKKSGSPERIKRTRERDNYRADSKRKERKISGKLKKEGVRAKKPSGEESEMRESAGSVMFKQLEKRAF